MDIYNAAILVQTIIEENNRLREETIKALLKYGKQEAIESSTN